MNVLKNDDLDEIIEEVNEVELVGVMSSARKRNYRRPKVQADVFNSKQKSPSTKALMAKPQVGRPPHHISKVVPSTNAAMGVYGTGASSDPVIALQKRMMEKRQQEQDQRNQKIVENNELRVLPMKKKSYGKSPGSSPEVRSGIQDVHYV